MYLVHKQYRCIHALFANVQQFQACGAADHKNIDGTPNTSLSPLAAAPPEEDVGRFVLSAVRLLFEADDGPGGPTDGRQQQQGQNDQQAHHAV